MALGEGKWGAEGSGWQPPWAVGCRGSPAPWGYSLLRQEVKKAKFLGR